MMMSAGELEMCISLEGIVGLTIDSTHHESYLRSVCGTSEMGINLFGFGLVKGDKSVQDVVASRSVIRTT